MYKIYLNYPDALRPSFPRLKERLEDTDPGKLFASQNLPSTNISIIEHLVVKFQ